MSWDVAGRRVLVTGANSGIGEATAAELARRGAVVTITTRDADKGASAAQRIHDATGTGVEVRHLDLSRLDSVRAFVDRFRDEHQRLDVLVNNAGVMTGERRETPDGFEWTFAVNHLGPFLLTRLLTPLIIESTPSRIINVSSEVHRRVKRGLDFDDLQMRNGYSSSKAYAASKLANILFTVELDRRLAEHGVTARALHPGVVATSFGKGAEGSRTMGLMMTVLSPVLRSPARGAATTVHLAAAPDRELDRGPYWSDEKPVEPSRAALDPDAAAQLWAASERLVGLAD